MGSYIDKIGQCFGLIGSVSKSSRQSQQDQTNNILIGTVDVSFAMDTHTRRSNGDYINFVNDGTIIWKSGLQSVVMLSSCEPEYIGVCVLLPLKLSVDKSSRPSDLKKHVCVCMWYVIMLQDNRYLKSLILGVQTVYVSRVSILIPSPPTPLTVCRTVP
jgi:hypothetical protein